DYTVDAPGAGQAGWNSQLVQVIDPVSRLPVLDESFPGLPGLYSLKKGGRVRLGLPADGPYMATIQLFELKSLGNLTMDQAIDLGNSVT
ncbi:MAG: hypothetical protein AAF514_14590, partial [Verrucomicrobiota bacterium]